VQWVDTNWPIIVMMGFLLSVVFTTVFDISILFIISLCATIAITQIIFKKPQLTILLIIVLILGIYLTERWDRLYWEPQLTEGVHEITGYVDTDPQKDEFNTKVTVRIDDSHERIRITMSRFPEYIYGQKITMKGEIEYPEAFETNSGRTFRYDNYLRQEKIYYVSRYASIKLTSEERGGNALKRILFDLKAHVVTRIEYLFPEPHSSLLNGLLLGVKSSLGPDLLRAFTVTGVIHIVVLSGFNVTIIAEALMRSLRFLGVRTSAIIGSISIILFAIITGASATIVRASIMALLVIVARVSGYQSAVIKTLLFAACIMVAYNPMILLYNPSFQLSFLATLGLIIVVPVVEKYLFFIPVTVFDLRGLAAASLGTQIFVFPLLIWMTGEVSLISPIANIVVLWVVPLTMLLGFIALVISFISIQLSLIPMMFAWVALGYILSAVTLFASIPYASVIIPPVSIVSVLIIYGLYSCVYLYSKK